MIKIDNSFIENFKTITCLCDIKTQMGFNVIYDKIVSKNDSDIKIIKTLIGTQKSKTLKNPAE